MPGSASNTSTQNLIFSKFVFSEVNNHPFGLEHRKLLKFTGGVLVTEIG